MKLLIVLTIAALLGELVDTIKLLLKLHELNIENPGNPRYSLTEHYTKRK